jgi:hypothetical protein
MHVAADGLRTPAAVVSSLYGVLVNTRSFTLKLACQKLPPLPPRWVYFTMRKKETPVHMSAGGSLRGAGAVARTLSRQPARLSLWPRLTACVFDPAQEPQEGPHAGQEATRTRVGNAVHSTVGAGPSVFPDALRGSWCAWPRTDMPASASPEGQGPQQQPPRVAHKLKAFFCAV